MEIERIKKAKKWFSKSLTESIQFWQNWSSKKKQKAQVNNIKTRKGEISRKTSV